jgi:hypothetical protein
MNLSLIRSFIADQVSAKDIVYQRFGVAPNTKAMDWWLVREQVRQQYAANPFAKQFYPHGSGLELAMDDLYIDFDYSNEGHPDGFDKWRLYVYLMGGKFNNNGPDNYIYQRMSAWFDGLALAGKIVHRDNLYYLA